MFRIFAAGLFIIVAIGLVLPAQAQTASPNEAALPPLSQQHLDLARQVFNASDSGRAFDEILPAVADRAKSTFIKTNPQMQLGVIDAVDRVALEMVGLRKELDDGLIRVWARAFSEEELLALLEFYQSPAGQKFAENYPKVISTQLALSDNWTLKIGNELARRVEAELAKMVRQDAQSLRGTTSDTTGQ